MKINIDSGLKYMCIYNQIHLHTEYVFISFRRLAINVNLLIEIKHTK